MDLSMRWLNDYVEIDDDPRAFSEAMTMSGSKVESFHKEAEEVSGVVVGKVLSVVPHENSDHLVICKVEDVYKRQGVFSRKKLLLEISRLILCGNGDFFSGKAAF